MLLLRKEKQGMSKRKNKMNNLQNVISHGFIIKWWITEITGELICQNWDMFIPHREENKQTKKKQNKPWDKFITIETKRNIGKIYGDPSWELHIKLCDLQ